MIHVLQPGLFTTVQDNGRWGYQRFGIPVAGPMDRVSHRLANLIVGNGPTCATLEVTLAGPRLEFQRDLRFAVSGAEFDLFLDGTPLSMDTAQPVRSGQCLAFGRRRRGARAYVAVAGGIDVPSVLGSRATHVASRMGGFRGRALAAGDVLAVGDAVERRARPGNRRVPAGGTAGRVRVLPGPDADRFGAPGAAVLSAAEYRVGAASDRMGYRLDGPALDQAGPELPSCAVPAGAIQVPPSGEPIILMADRPTSGGYPRIGTVITADIPVLAQLAPADRVAFEACGLETAMQALIAQERALLA